MAHLKSNVQYLNVKDRLENIEEKYTFEVNNYFFLAQISYELCIETKKQNGKIDQDIHKIGEENSQEILVQMENVG